MQKLIVETLAAALGMVRGRPGEGRHTYMLIDVGGSHLHAQPLGEDGSTVVVDAGLSDSADQWGTVPARVAAFARLPL